MSDGDELRTTIFPTGLAPETTFLPRSHVETGRVVRMVAILKSLIAAVLGVMIFVCDCVCHQD
jgi:hypothetical protein